MQEDDSLDMNSIQYNDFTFITIQQNVDRAGLQETSWDPIRFTNDFSIAIQIQWKFHFTLTLILTLRSLQNFAHDTTAGLSWHVQKFVAIWWQTTELQQGEVPIQYEMWAKKR